MTSQYRIQAMQDRGIGIAVVSLVDRFVLFENGVKMDIYCFYDEDHEETSDLEEVRYYEFGNRREGYGNGYISEADADEGVTFH